MKRKKLVDTIKEYFVVAYCAYGMKINRPPMLGNVFI